MIVGEKIEALPGAAVTKTTVVAQKEDFSMSKPVYDDIEGESMFICSLYLGKYFSWARKDERIYSGQGRSN